MKLNLAQTKLVGLTMELELKTREYKMLCDKLDKYKKENIDENHEKLYELLEEFQKNHDEIKEIKEQLKKIESIKETNEEKNVEYNYNDIFKRKNEKKIEESNNTSKNTLIEHNETLWEKIKRRLKALFNK